MIRNLCSEQIQSSIDEIFIMNPNKLQTPPRAKLEHVTAHPLSEEAGSTASSSINTASLIQSAARSILDGSSPETHVSDDDSCSNGHRNTPSLTLQSLQARVVPAMPDEQDRKRFLVSSRSTDLYNNAK